MAAFLTPGDRVIYRAILRSPPTPKAPEWPAITEAARLADLPASTRRRVNFRLATIHEKIPAFSRPAPARLQFRRRRWLIAELLRGNPAGISPRLRAALAALTWPELPRARQAAIAGVSPRTISRVPRPDA